MKNTKPQTLLSDTQAAMLSNRAYDMMRPQANTSAVFDHANQLSRLDTLPESLDNAKLWKARAVKLQALRAIIEAYDDNVKVHCHLHTSNGEEWDFERLQDSENDWEAAIDMIDNLDNALGAVWNNLDYDTQLNVSNPKPLKSTRLANGTDIA